MSVNKSEVRALRLMYIRGDAESGEATRMVAQADISHGDEVRSHMAEKALEGGESHPRLSRAVWEKIESGLSALVGTDTDNRDLIATILKREQERVTREFKKEQEQARRHRGSVAYRAWREARRQGRLVVNRMKGVSPPTSLGLRQIDLAFQTLNELFLMGGVSLNGGRDSLEDFYEDHLEKVTRYAVAPTPPAPQINGRGANSFDDAPFIEPLPKDGTKGHLLEREALKYGFSSIRFPGGSFVAADAQGNRLNFKWGRSPIASGVALSICSYKETTRRLLAKAGIPVAAGRVFSPKHVEAALDYADHIGYPVVCKPVAGLRGIGVITDIKSRQELKEALDLYSKSQLGNDDFVIEEQVPGEDYRIVIIDGEVVASVVREAASVEGSGIHTVADLIEYKNRARRKNPHLSSRLIPLSDAVEYQLSHAGLTYASIPEAGQKVTVANSANLSQGGDSFEVAAELHPTIKELAVKAVEAIPGLGFCGLDMLIEDHTKPVDQQRVTVIELNAHAAIGSAQYPMWGPPSQVADTFFRATAAHHGIDLPSERKTHLSMDLIIKGRVTGVGYRWWFKRLADRFGVTGHIRNVNKRTVFAHIEGDADAVSALGYVASRGPRRALTSSVTMEHSPEEGCESFEIIRPPATPRNVARTLLKR